MDDKTNNFAIESGIPVTMFSNNQRGGYNSKYPFRKMKVGDSFLVNSNFHNVRSCAYMASRRGLGKFVSRTVEGGLRIWRVE